MEGAKRSMEDITIRDMTARVCATVDLDIVLDNVKKITALVSSAEQLIAVVKTDAYGHGAVPVALHLEAENAVGGFAVATAQEAHILRKAGIRKMILILGYVFPENFEQLIEEEIRITVFDTETCRLLAEASERVGKKAKVHIKVDTGMNRIGIKPDENGEAFLKELAGFAQLEAEGIFTHFARADEEEKEAADRQFTLFEEFVSRAQQILGKRIPIRHCANSAAILTMKETHLDAVRPGIILYGLSPSDEVTAEAFDLKPVLSLYSQVVYIKELKAGESISYGGTFTATGPMRVATIPVGYGDGYPRMLSGKGYVLIRGRRARILGRVCMDQFMVDITQIPDAVTGDRVTLIGSDGQEIIRAEHLGELCGRFHYELVCDLGRRIPRVYLRNGRTAAVRAPYSEDVNWMQ